MTTIAQVQEAVAVRFQIERGALIQPTRFRKVTWPRQMAYLLCLTQTRHSSVRIALAFGGRDHSTIAYGARMARDRIRSDPVWADHYASIKRALTQA